MLPTELPTAMSSNVRGRDQEELFRAVSYFLEVQMAGSRTMFHAAEPDSFSVNAFVRGAVADGARAFRSLYDMEFRMMFDIRDGQVCVRAPGGEGDASGDVRRGR